MRCKGVLCGFVFTVFACVGTGLRTVNSTEEDYILVSLDGKNTNQFASIQGDFQKLVASLATNFCNSSGFTGYGNINSSTVEIHTVEACPYEWPNADLCVNVNFSVPIENSSRYELSRRHLYSMWETCSNFELGPLGVQLYEIPSSSSIFVLWFCVTGLLFFLFLLIVLVVVKTKFIENYLRRRRDIIGSSNRSWANKKQLVPPFFYPEAPSEKNTEVQIQYVSTANGKQHTFGIENPGYDPERTSSGQLEHQVSNSNVIVDDFDSDDETIYPPSPLPRLPQQRNDRGNVMAISKEELETAL